jgi:hypothetical protein
MITLPELAADALGSFLASDMKDRFGASYARLTEIVPFAARLALGECIGNSDARAGKKCARVSLDAVQSPSKVCQS